MTFILSNTITLFIVKSVAGMATDLTINYAKFVALNVWNFAPLLCYANLDPLNILSSILLPPAHLYTPTPSQLLNGAYNPDTRYKAPRVINVK